LGPLFLKGLLVLHLLGRDLVTRAEDLVEGQQGRGHAATTAQEVAPTQALLAGGAFTDGGQPGFVLLLLRRLGRRNEFLIGSNARRNRRGGFNLSVQFALTDPHDGCSLSDGKRENVPTLPSERCQ